MMEKKQLNQKELALSTNKKDTQKKIFDVALFLFRKKGFSATTLREIAREAKLSLGAAYHYYPSKDSILISYYEQTLIDLEKIGRAIENSPLSFREKLSYLMHERIRSIRQDKALLAELLGVVLAPAGVANIWGVQTQHIRTKSLSVFLKLLDKESFSSEIKELWAYLLFALQLGYLFFFVYDQSPDEQKTHEVIDKSLSLVLPLMQFSTVSFAVLWRNDLKELFRVLGLDLLS